MTRKGWIWLAFMVGSGVIACFVPAKAQRYCYTLGADMAQCTDGTFALGLGQGNVLITAPETYAVPETTTRAYLAPLITTQELIEAAAQAKRDCFGERPGALNTCHKRSDIEAELVSRNMCFGRAGQAQADSRWQKCER
jgi:hypothetical protein